MTAPTPVVPCDQLGSGAQRAVRVGEAEIALFNLNGQYRAIGNRCPHRGGPLARGRVEQVTVEGVAHPAVRCPIHGWVFDLTTGRCLNQPQASVPAYAVTCQDDMICLAP